MRNVKMEYALYKGDEFIMIGTKKEVAERLNVKPNTISFYLSPTYKKRTGCNGIVVLKLEGE